MNNLAQTILQSLQAKQPLLQEQLQQWCEINTGTENLMGLALMRECLQIAFTPLADTITVHAMQPITTIDMAGQEQTQSIGDALFLSKRPHLKRRVLLCGHMDTVYANNHPFQKLQLLHGNHLIGPGVADMKGGLLVILQALTSFEQSNEATAMGWDVLINADEEIGSPASSALLEALAPNYQAALVYEPALSTAGTLAKNRKGSAKFTLIAKGKAAHAGRAFAEGRNAICYLAEAVTAIHALNGQRDGVTINVGRIAGGGALNVVPDTAVAKLDVRISAPDDAHWLTSQLDALVTQLTRSEYGLSIQGNFGRPVKQINHSTAGLFHKLQHAGKALGLQIDWQDSGGCCDGNNLAAHGLSVLDSLGVCGGNIHSSEEFVNLDSIAERAALSAMLLIDLAQGGLEELTA